MYYINIGFGNSFFDAKKVYLLAVSVVFKIINSAYLLFFLIHFDRNKIISNYIALLFFVFVSF